MAKEHSSMENSNYVSEVVVHYWDGSKKVISDVDVINQIGGLLCTTSHAELKEIKQMLNEMGRIEELEGTVDCDLSFAELFADNSYYLDFGDDHEDRCDINNGHDCLKISCELEQSE